jgi:hypothetical protein
MNKFLASSADPTKLSLTIKGVLLSLLPIILVVTGMTEETVQPIIDGIVQIVFLVTSLISAVQIIYGLIRKIYFTQAGE